MRMLRNRFIGLLATFLTLGSIAVLSAMVDAVPGDLDLTFGNGGTVIDGVTRASENAYDIAIQPDGKIVVAADFAIARYNADGSLDASFGSGGKVFTRTRYSAVSPVNVAVSSVAIQLDGRIIAGGVSDGRFGLVRLNADGSLDTSFGGGGVVTTLISQAGSRVSSVVIQPDGKILAVGSRINPVSSEGDAFVLVRYDPGGSLDQTFGNNGIVTTQVGGYATSASSVALQPNNKIVVVGGACCISGRDFAAARYNTDGSLDKTFGNAGQVVTPISSNWDGARSVAIQSDGKIVAAGFVLVDPESRAHQATVRYNTDGSPDATFGNAGIATAAVPGGGGTNGVAVQADGKIITTASAAGSFSLVRYTIGGSLDTSFGNDGIASMPGGRSYAVVQQADGKIVAAGHFYYGISGLEQDIALARFNTDGSLDTSFDSDGTVRTDFGLFAENRLYAVATHPDGKIAAAGYSGYTLVRYGPDGSRDTSFNGTGYATADPWGGPTHVAVTFQPDGKTVVAGIAYYGDMYDMGFDVLRYNSDGTPDTAFGDNGRVNFSSATGGDWSDASWVHIQADGKIVAGGGDRIFRLNPDGSPDATFGSDGIANVPLYAYASAIQSNGKIVIAGPRWNGSVSNSTHDLVVARLDPDGSLDPAFGSGGAVTIPMSIGVSREIVARTVATQTDGKIVAGGYRLVRLTENGSLDTAFGNDGIVTPPMASFRGLVIQTDGKLAIAGSSNNDFAIARYDANGSLDTTFGGGDGITTVDFNNSNDTLFGMTLDAHGRVVVVGESNGAFALARLIVQPAVTVSGRVLSATGAPIRNAVVTITDPLGNTRTTITSTFGNYSFDNVLSGPIYTLRASAKRFRFQPMSLAITDGLNELDLVADRAE